MVVDMPGLLELIELSSEKENVQPDKEEREPS